MGVSSKVKLSILIPLQRITPQLQETINNLNIGNNYGRDFEVVLSFDGTEQSQNLEIPINLRGQVRKIHSKKQMGAAYARNAAAKSSGGEFLCFVDSDVILPVNFLDRWFEHDFDNKTYYSARIYPIDSTSQVSHLFNAIILRKQTRYGIPYIVTATSWLQRDLFLKIGKFDEGFTDAAGEDSEFCLRAHKEKVQLEETDIIVYHDNPTTLEEFKARAERYATKGNLFHEKLREFYGQSQNNQNFNRKYQNANFFLRAFLKILEEFGRILQELLKQTLALLKLILNVLTMNQVSKIKRFALSMRLGFQYAEESYDHHFVKFTLSRKAKFVFYALLWTYTYRKHMQRLLPSQKSQS
jgi:glycosyltransferase involved in cell wall biosynthesis